MQIKKGPIEPIIDSKALKNGDDVNIKVLDEFKLKNGNFFNHHKFGIPDHEIWSLSLAVKVQSKSLEPFQESPKIPCSYCQVFVGDSDGIIKMHVHSKKLVEKIMKMEGKCITIRNARFMLSHVTGGKNLQLSQEFNSTIKEMPSDTIGDLTTTNNLSK